MASFLVRRQKSLLEKVATKSCVKAVWRHLFSFAFSSFFGPSGLVKSKAYGLKRSYFSLPNDWELKGSIYYQTLLEFLNLVHQKQRNHDVKASLAKSRENELIFSTPRGCPMPMEQQWWVDFWGQINKRGVSNKHILLNRADELIYYSNNRGVCN